MSNLRLAFSSRLALLDVVSYLIYSLLVMNISVDVAGLELFVCLPHEAFRDGQDSSDLLIISNSAT